MEKNIMDNITLTIFWDGKNVGLDLKEGGNQLNWEDMTIEQQYKLLNGLTAAYNLYSRFIKKG